MYNNYFVWVLGGLLTMALLSVSWLYLSSYETESDNPDNNGQELISVEHDDKIRVFSPLPNEAVASPLNIVGEARGMWFFEATFPVVLTNWDGLIIAEGYAEAKGDWMTEDYVPFTATLEFVPDVSVSDRATLILQRNNASGLPENDDALEYNVRFE